MKMNNSILLIILAISAGAMIPFQSAMNADLGKSLQSPYFSALSVFIIAAIGLTIFILITKQTLPGVQHFTSAPKWSYLGGILGGTYILLIVLLAPKLGIGNVTVLVLLGQILAAMVIDQFGLLGATIHLLNWQRLLGVVLLVSGVYLIKKF
ncbi:DMT family transporter [Chryseotalea sanaruensis]|uniref:DMT family transporter n=2 Tax=Chryseotalea sanaruensis TaxID=2482724 RepID=A0A401UF60_9BACT|nr:DMT family transporter [Chryseotalea sanaruensis]